MLRRPPEAAVSKHGPPASFETRPSAAPHHEAGRVAETRSAEGAGAPRDAAFETLLAIARAWAHSPAHMPTTLNQALPYLVAAVVLSYAVVRIFF